MIPPVNSPRALSMSAVVAVRARDDLGPGPTTTTTVTNTFPRPYLARFNADSTYDKTFAPNPNANVNTLLLQPDGKLLVQPLPVGDIQVSEKMMEHEAALINDAFLVTLFQILTETPQMTATEALIRAQEKGAMIAPAMGRQQSEFLGPLINRELDLLSHSGMLPPAPDALRRKLHKTIAKVVGEAVAPKPKKPKAQKPDPTVGTAHERQKFVDEVETPGPVAFRRQLPEP